MAAPGRTNQEFTHKSPTTTGGSKQIQDSPNTQKESCIQKNEAVKVTIKLNVLLDSIYIFLQLLFKYFFMACVFTFHHLYREFIYVFLFRYIILYKAGPADNIL